MYKNYKNRVEILESIKLLLWTETHAWPSVGILAKNLGTTKNTL